MKKTLLIACVAISVLVFSCSNNSTEPEDEKLILSIIPSEQTVNTGSEATYSVKIENVSDLFAISCEIVFNNGVVGVPIDPVTKGDFWGDDTIITTKINYDRLCVAIGQIQTSGEDGLDGDGILFDFKVTGILAGESDLIFQNLNLIDENGEQVDDFDEIEINNGKLIIQ